MARPGRVPKERWFFLLALATALVATVGLVLLDSGRDREAAAAAQSVAGLDGLTPEQAARVRAGFPDPEGAERALARGPVRRQSKAPPGFTATESQPPELFNTEDSYFSTSQLWPVINAWQVASRTRFTAVYGGGDGVNDSHSTTGRIAVFRQNYLRTSQSMKIIDVPDAGPIKITKAPVGKRRGLNTLQGEAVLRFKGKRGLSGRFFLADYSVKLDSQP